MNLPIKKGSEINLTVDSLSYGGKGISRYDGIVICPRMAKAEVLRFEGDTVVLAGKGHETYQVVGDEYRPFDERVIVRDCLAELGVG